MIEFHSFLRACVLIASGFTLGHTASGVPEQEFDRQQLQQLEDKAVALKKLEQQNPGNNDIHDQRVRAFAVAAINITNYAIRYTNAPDLGRLLLMYRMAINLELAEEMKDAKSEFESCEIHPLYHSVQAVYSGKRIDVLVPERLQALMVILNLPQDARVSMAYTPMGTDYVITSVKGLIAPTDRLPVHADIHDLGAAQISPESLRSMQRVGSISGRP